MLTGGLECLELRAHLEVVGNTQMGERGIRNLLKLVGEVGSNEQAVPRTHSEIGQREEWGWVESEKQPRLRSTMGVGMRGWLCWPGVFWAEGDSHGQDCRALGGLPAATAKRQWGGWLLQKPVAHHWGTQHWQTPSSCHLFSTWGPAIILEHEPEYITLFREYHTPLSEPFTGFTFH